MSQLQDSKAKAPFNWHAAIERIRPLEDIPRGAFASSREAEYAISIYNRALNHMFSDNGDIAMIALEKLVSTYPLFTEANLLYGLSLADLRKYKEAEEQFEKALLADPSSEQHEKLESYLSHAQAARKLNDEYERSRRKNERKLINIRADIAQGGFLERAAGSTSTESVRMASPKEREEMMQQIRNDEEKSALSADYDKDRSGKMLKAVSVIVIIAALIFFLVYFLLAPAINRVSEQKDRLEWLEKRLEEGAKSEEAVEIILEDYHNSFSDPGK